MELELVIDDVGAAASINDRATQLRAMREQRDGLTEEITKKTVALARELDSNGVPERDIAALVGATQRRVNTLLRRERK